MNTAAPTLAETWLAPVAQAIEEILWVWDPAGQRITFANTAFQRFWGFLPTEDADGLEVLLSRVHPEDRERLQTTRSQAAGKGYAQEYRVVLPTGEGGRSRTVHLSERAIPISTPGGARRIAHVARDVSWQHDTTARLRAEIDRRAHAERGLEQVTQRLQALIATANDAVITIDETSHIVDWNQAAEGMFGWRRDEAVGRVLTDLIVPPAQRRHHHDGIQRFLRDGSSRMFGQRVETMALRRDGGEFHVELSVWPVKSGERHTFSSFIRDISRRKAAERALAESEAKYRKVVENVNEGILVTAGGYILYANPRALALTGLDLETARSKPFIDFIHGDDRERVLDNHMRRLHGEPAENHYQFRVMTMAGEARWLEVSSVVFEWQGAPATLNFVTDVTGRRQAEEELRGTLARERELSELKSRFVAVASHEFRTPLAAILSSIELLDDYGTRLPEAEWKEVVGLVKTAVGRMNGMIEQVLLTSRLEAGQFGFDPKPQSAARLLAQLAGELAQADTRAARITVHCEDGSLRRLDARLLRHILSNLLGNALKYSPPDSPVGCTARGLGEHLLIEVRDQGIGIPAADLPRLFERFQRGGNVGNIQGTGIGLHIVNECVLLHGGTIEIESEPGRGSTFRVRLLAPLVE